MNAVNTSVNNRQLNGDSVRDHCHVTGKFHGAAHGPYILKLRFDPRRFTIPVVFHSLCRHDSHMLMQAISKVNGEITCIPNTTE